MGEEGSGWNGPNTDPWRGGEGLAPIQMRVHAWRGGGGEQGKGQPSLNLDLWGREKWP